MTEHDNPFTAKLPDPTGAMRQLYKLPILLYRLGFGPLVGKLFMILTTRGRKSGLPRHTPVEYRTYHGRKYVMVGWPKSDWYRNILADPLVTIQTAAGTESVKAARWRRTRNISTCGGWSNTTRSCRACSS